MFLFLVARTMDIRLNGRPRTPSGIAWYLEPYISVSTKWSNLQRARPRTATCKSCCQYHTAQVQYRYPIFLWSCVNLGFCF